MATLLEKYHYIRAYTEQICTPLHIEDYIPQPIEYTSPPKWHLAHVTWFFEQMILKPFVSDYQVFNTDFAFLFNSYYQSLGKRSLRCERGIMTRPTVDEIYQYRKYVDQHMQSLLNNQCNNQIQKLVILGMNHEQQHQELLLTDLKYTFALNPTHPVYHPDSYLVADHNTESGWLSVECGNYSIGYSGDDFCFDNELGVHTVYLHDYQIAKSLVTNAEYIEFIEAGGYQQCQYWLDDGWNWVTENQITHPLYWHNIDNQWYYYTLAGLQPVDPDAMVCHTSYYEANAFASWCNCRLPTEFEWEVASPNLNWGKRWEWTSSAYSPYPNFTISEGAVGEYNGKFMINQMVLRGASTATPEGHSRQTYRNFFQPQLQWQFFGIRLAK